MGLFKSKKISIFKLEDYLEATNKSLFVPFFSPNFRIIWFVKGVGNHRVDFKTISIIPNTVIFLSKNQLQKFDHPNYKGLVLEFSKSFLIQKENDIDFFVRCVLFNTQVQEPFCYLGINAIMKLKRYISLFEEEFANTDTFGKEEILRLYLKAFLIQVQRCKLYSEGKFITTKIPLQINTAELLLIKFINLVEEYYMKRYSVSKFSQKLCVSSKTLSNITRRYLNKTPSKIIHERILLEAKRLLLYSNQTIKEISYQLGFFDPSYFVRFFKKNVGKSPYKFKVEAK